MTKRVSLGLLIFVALLVAMSAGVVFAKNTWSNYHWERSDNSVTVRLGDNMTTTAWSGILGDVFASNSSDVLDTLLEAGSPDDCDKTKMVNGTVQVCNGGYGPNGWLGLATIQIDAASHIQAGTAQVNDYYFTGTRNNDYARQHVLCQEVFHTTGLHHQKKPQARSCMNDNWGLSDPGFVSLDGHDHETLDDIYAHQDGTGGGGGGGGGGNGGPDCDEKPNHPRCQQGGPGNSNGDWGKAVGKDDKGRPNQFEKDLGGGRKRITFVTWAD